MKRALEKKEFESFVMNMYHNLIYCERKKMGGLSTLDIFCLLTVELFLKVNGNLGYFVNEVERTLTTGLWTRNLEVNYNIFAGTFVSALVRWADNLPYLS
jgi:hypothetical protein